MAIAPFLTTGFSTPAPIDTMEACGGLMIEVKVSTPNMPRFDTAVVPPWYSSGFSFLSRARLAISFTSADMTDNGFSSARRTMGVISPSGMATATPTSECLCRSRAVDVQEPLAIGTSRKASASALMMKSFTDNL